MIKIRLFWHFLNSYRITILLIAALICVFYIKISNRTETDDESDELFWKLKGFKTILAYNIPSWFNIRPGTKVFTDLHCPVNKCRLTTKDSERRTADLVLFHEHYVRTDYPRSPNQIYALYNIETPPHTSRIEYPDIINWTISYRYDSTIPAPYRKWVYFDPEIRQKEQHRNYAANKTKMIAWFVSNCNDRNGRLKYALELQKYVQVDIYGKCGSLNCSRENTLQCYDMLDRDYKFYLAFENSNCKDYITEKLFENALQRNVLPIVMGAPPEDYAKYAPQRSYIHVDEFESPIELAEYLHELDKNDEMYNAYFQWKGTGQVTHAPKYYFCEMCDMLHDDQVISTPKWFADVNEWWRGPGICSNSGVTKGPSTM